MNRQEFITKCGLACLGGGTFASLLQGCVSQKMISGTIAGSDLIIPIREFEVLKKDQIQFRSYLVVQHSQLQYPVCVYRSNDHDFTAIWMRCTHQGTELQVYGDTLHCPGHGSEFNSKGGVENGPAVNALRTFPVIVADGQLRISLK